MSPTLFRTPLLHTAIKMSKRVSTAQRPPTDHSSLEEEEEEETNTNLSIFLDILHLQRHSPGRQLPVSPKSATLEVEEVLREKKTAARLTHSINEFTYSSFTEEKATNLNLTGFVKNASDGTVRYPSAGIFPFAFSHCIPTLRTHSFVCGFNKFLRSSEKLKALRAIWINLCSI